MNPIQQSLDAAARPSERPLHPLFRSLAAAIEPEVSIESTRPASPSEWDTIWRETHYSTYFQSREWAEIWDLYTKGSTQPAPLMVHFSDGNKALLPLSLQKSHRGVVRTFLLSPAGTFGGWISSDPLEIGHAIALSDLLTTRLGDMVWRLNPYDPLVFKAGVRTNHEDETQVFDLRSGFEAVDKGWTKEHGSALRKARREGVTVRQAKSLDDWREYYGTYEDSLRRWAGKATSRYSWDLFKNIFERNSPAVKLWVSVYRKKIIAGALCFYAPRHVVYWHGAAIANYFLVRPVDLLVYEAVKDACEAGYDWFDFNPSGGHEGVKAFKRSFGAISLPCPVFCREGIVARLASTASRFARRIRR